jgi:hypothetical protein
MAFRTVKQMSASTERCFANAHWKSQVSKASYPWEPTQKNLFWVGMYKSQSCPQFGWNFLWNFIWNLCVWNAKPVRKWSKFLDHIRNKQQSDPAWSHKPSFLSNLEYTRSLCCMKIKGIMFGYNSNETDSRWTLDEHKVTNQLNTTRNIIHIN